MAVATTDWSAQAIRDTLSTYAERDPNVLMQQFGLRRSDVAALQLFEMMTPGLLSSTDLMKLANSVEGQSHEIQGIYKKKALGVGATRVQKGTGKAEVANVTPSFQALIQEGIEDSFIPHLLRQVSSEDLADKGSRARQGMIQHMDFNLRETFRNIYTRLNKQAVAYLEANKWTLSSLLDAGKFYTTLQGNDKVIPKEEIGGADALAIPTFLQRLRIEMKQNNFDAFGRVFMLGSEITEDLLNRYIEKGEGQAINVVRNIGNFAYLDDAEITDGDNGATPAVADIGTFYLIANNSLARYSRITPYFAHPDAVNGRLNLGENNHMPPIRIGAGTGILPGLPSISLEHFMWQGLEDTSAANTVDSSKLDVATHHSFVCQQGLERARDFADTDISPIIKYRVTGAAAS